MREESEIMVKLALYEANRELIEKEIINIIQHIINITDNDEKVLIHPNSIASVVNFHIFNDSNIGVVAENDVNRILHQSFNQDYSFNPIWELKSKN